MALNLHRIDLLTGANNSMYKFKLRWILIKQDLWGHITGDVTQPEPVDANVVTPREWQQITEWDRKDQQDKQ